MHNKVRCPAMLFIVQQNNKGHPYLRQTEGTIVGFEFCRIVLSVCTPWGQVTFQNPCPIACANVPAICHIYDL